MSFSILDGKGSGKEAGVDSRNRLITATISESESNNATFQGTKYNVNTGTVTLTSAAKTSILYLKNNEESDVVIDALIYNIGVTSGGSGDIHVDIIRNPTAGAIVTNANNVAIGTGPEANLNFGSSRTLTADMFVGATGESVLTDGDEIIKTINPTPTGRIFISPGGGFLIPKGKSVGINYTPPVGNTSQEVQFAFNLYIKETT